jgi:hypothetical protein
MASEETLAFMEVMVCEDSRDAALECWAIVYEKWSEGVETTQSEAQARQNCHLAEAKLQAALASLRRKQKVRRECEGPWRDTDR